MAFTEYQKNLSHSRWSCVWITMSNRSCLIYYLYSPQEYKLNLFNNRLFDVKRTLFKRFRNPFDTSKNIRLLTLNIQTLYTEYHHQVQDTSNNAPILSLPCLISMIEAIQTRPPTQIYLILSAQALQNYARLAISLLKPLIAALITQAHLPHRCIIQPMVLKDNNDELGYSPFPHENIQFYSGNKLQKCQKTTNDFPNQYKSIRKNTSLKTISISQTLRRSLRCSMHAPWINLKPMQIHTKTIRTQSKMIHTKKINLNQSHINEPTCYFTLWLASWLYDQLKQTHHHAQCKLRIQTPQLLIHRSEYTAVSRYFSNIRRGYWHQQFSLIGIKIKLTWRKRRYAIQRFLKQRRCCHYAILFSIMGSSFMLLGMMVKTLLTHKQSETPYTTLSTQVIPSPHLNPSLAAHITPCTIHIKKEINHDHNHDQASCLNLSIQHFKNQTFYLQLWPDSDDNQMIQLILTDKKHRIVYAHGPTLPFNFHTTLTQPLGLSIQLSSIDHPTQEFYYATLLDLIRHAHACQIEHTPHQRFWRCRLLKHPITFSKLHQNTQHHLPIWLTFNALELYDVIQQHP